MATALATGPATGLALPLTLTVPCRASAGARSSRHDVVIGPDWTVRTGHDEGLERIAAALGGGVSCMPMLRETLPGFRTWWERALRLPGLLIRSPDRGSTWHSSDGLLGCCPANGFLDPHAAASHVRAVAHVAATTGVPRRHLQAMVAGLRDRADPVAPGVAGGSPPDPVTTAAWSCGLGVEWLAGVRARIASAAGSAVELDLLLALAQTGADPGWVVGTAQAVTMAGEPDPTLLRWLAWTATDLDASDPKARTAWLRTGARRDDVAALSEAGYLPGAVEEIARGWRLSRPTAAQWLARWVALGYRPEPTDLVALHDLGLGFPPPPPARSAVERVLAMVGGGVPKDPSVPADPSGRTDLAVEFVRRGNARDTAEAVRRRRRSQVRRGASA